MFQQTIPAQEMNEWVSRFTGRRRFIIQPYLSFATATGIRLIFGHWSKRMTAAYGPSQESPHGKA